MECHTRASSLSVDDMGQYRPFMFHAITVEPQTDVIPTTGSLPDARGHTFGSNREYDWL